MTVSKKTKLTSSELESFRKSLEAKREKVLKTVENLEGKALNSSVDFLNDTSSWKSNISEASAQVSELETNLDLTQNEQKLLQKIENALERIETKQYGLCEECGCVINKMRLEAIPETNFCIDCAQKNIG